MRTTGQSEAEFQRRLTRHYEGEGWLVVRLLRTNVGGLPDLVLLHPERRAVFVEVKAAGGSVGAVQQYRHEELRAMGFEVVVVWPDGRHGVGSESGR